MKENVRKRDQVATSQNVSKATVVAALATVHTIVDNSHMDVAPTVPEVAVETQEAVRDLRQKIPVTPAVEPIISLRVASKTAKSKYEMIVQSKCLQ